MVLWGGGTGDQVKDKDGWGNRLWKWRRGEEAWAHLSLLLRSFQEESVDDRNRVGLDVLISPAENKQLTQ